jgi:hypothetical protein
MSVGIPELPELDDPETAQLRLIVQTFRALVRKEVVDATGA